MQTRYICGTCSQKLVHFLPLKTITVAFSIQCYLILIKMQNLTEFMDSYREIDPWSTTQFCTCILLDVKGYLIYCIQLLKTNDQPSIHVKISYLGHTPSEKKKRLIM